ncbi:MAG: formate acetyltransferase [Desulfobacteraceae bacterium]|nr:formate acetyltransferase [Desulfobacteraceae bacterium]
MKDLFLNQAAHACLWMMAAQFNLRPSLKQQMKSRDGWTDFTIGLRTASGSVAQAISFSNGKARVFNGIPEHTDAILHFVDDSALTEVVRITPNEMLNLVLKNKIILYGNMGYLQAFNYYVSLVMGPVHQLMLDRAGKRDRAARKKEFANPDPDLSAGLTQRKTRGLKAENKDPGVKFLNDPFLSQYSLEDFPRIKELHENHFKATPEISSERPGLLTDWYRKNGFETDDKGRPWFPELRQAHAFKHLMENKKPAIRSNNLVAGTCTPERHGVLIYPDTTGTMIWGELGSIEKRLLTPCRISPKTAAELHDLFPFWAKRTTREWIRNTYDYPLCQKIDERAVASFNFKIVCMSHTVPDLPAFVRKGTEAMIREIRREIKNLDDGETEKIQTLESMILCLEGLNAYGANLSRHAEKLARAETDPERKAELEHLARISSRVPARPAQTLDEAVNSAWISWVGLLMENNNVSLSPGRLDQLFQPYFERDMARLETDGERTEYIKHAIELISCYFMINAEHYNLVPDVANYLFGGSQSETAITVGGVTPDGGDAVNDMTYLFLKVTEMLSLNDPNMNARFKSGVNSNTYLKRLCEVNYTTVATPSMHNDDAVITSFGQNSDRIEDLRDWAATGCVEISLSGKHMSHTGATSVNMVAGLEMALNNGYHPLMNWQLGPCSGQPEKGDFKTFEAFFAAFAAQQEFIIDQTIEMNNMAGAAYAWLRPTPLLSSAMQGAKDNALDVTKGGALYNTSGSFNIGLADVVDSLMAIKTLVYDTKAVTFAELKQAIDTDFENHPALHAMICNKVARFGSGSDVAVEMANRVTGLIHKAYKSRKNFRGGDYTVGFWSVAQHVAYGALSGALPSGRRAFTSFTPGTTPHPGASNSFLDNMRDVAGLNPRHMDNNIAFNVKLVPSARDSRKKTVDTMAAYVKSYFDQGGMQIQFNMVDSRVLRDAMANPENYKNLLVRISGYNAYFVNLNRQMQMELVERAEYRL